MLMSVEAMIMMRMRRNILIDKMTKRKGWSSSKYRPRDYQFEDDVRDSGAAQSNQQEEEEGGGRNEIVEENGNGAILSEMEDLNLREQLYAKAKGQGTIWSMLKAKSDDPSNSKWRQSFEEWVNDLRAEAGANSMTCVDLSNELWVSCDGGRWQFFSRVKLKLKECTKNIREYIQ